MIFFIESSFTPIYNRLAIAIYKELIRIGHTVYYFNPYDFNEEKFVEVIGGVEFDYYISTNEGNYVQSYSNFYGRYLFELLNKKFIFIHHDNSYARPGNLFDCYNKLTALINKGAAVSHFCIENSSITRFKAVGIDRSFKIFHASEFENDMNSTELSMPGKYEKNSPINFVGHLTSGLDDYPFNNGIHSSKYFNIYNQRIQDNSSEVQCELIRILKEEHAAYLWGNSNGGDIAALEVLLHDFSKLSMPYRGDIIGKISNHNIDIYGGDLSYGSLNENWMKLKKANIKYKPATHDYNKTQNIYRDTKISLNISSLQFDSAINNRIIDIIMAGGFVLTDARDDLNIFGGCVNDVVYRNNDELQTKLDYYLDPSNANVYRQLKKELYDIFKRTFTYEKVIGKMLLDLMD